MKKILHKTEHDFASFLYESISEIFHDRNNKFWFVCFFQFGVVKCGRVSCPALNCTNGYLVRSPGACCPRCASTGEAPRGNRTSSEVVTSPKDTTSSTGGVTSSREESHLATVLKGNRGQNETKSRSKKNRKRKERKERKRKNKKRARKNRKNRRRIKARRKRLNDVTSNGLPIHWMDYSFCHA